MPPQSQTTASPGPITRSLAVWCGDAPFGPLPTLQKTGCRPRAASNASRRSRTSHSVSPVIEKVRNSSQDLIGAARGLGQQRDLALVLDHPQWPQELPALGPAGSRHGALQAKGEDAPQLVAGRDRAQGGGAGDRGDLRRRILRLLPGNDLEQVTLVVEERRFQSGHDVVRRAVPRQDEHAHALRLVPLVADQIEEVGGGADDEEVDALPCHLRLGAPQAIGVRGRGGFRILELGAREDMRAVLLDAAIVLAKSDSSAPARSRDGLVTNFPNFPNFPGSECGSSLALRRQPTSCDRSPDLHAGSVDALMTSQVAVVPGYGATMRDDRVPRSGFLQVAYGILRDVIFHAGAMCGDNPRSSRRHLPIT